MEGGGGYGTHLNKRNQNCSGFFFIVSVEIQIGYALMKVLILPKIYLISNMMKVYRLEILAM